MAIGDSVNGVRTTGIYCRAGCPAKPAARNVTHYRSGVAAEAAGFRPCLRCRPDRLPPLAGDGGQEMLGRALLLITEGALDDSTEVILARRLGVSERHLRRLFLNQIGATPGFIARSRRAHFVRRLLDETDLPMEALAAAAGFGSLRQMNRVVLDTFRFTPAQLRAKRRDADRLVSDGGLRLRMPFSGALDFEAMLEFRGPRLVPGVESVIGGVYRRTIVACGHPGMIEVARGGEGHLLLTAHLPTFTGLIDDVARCRRMFGLDQPAEAPAMLAADPLLGPIVRKRPGQRPPIAWDAFEGAAVVICGRRRPTSARLAEAFGEPIPGLRAHGLSLLFPTAEKIAAASVESLAATGLSPKRARTLHELARAYRMGQIKLDGSLSLEDCVCGLMDLPGVDSPIAHEIAMFAAGYLEAFSAEDGRLRDAAGRLAGRSGLMGPEELAERASSWQPYGALGGLYLLTSPGPAG